MDEQVDAYRNNNKLEAAGRLEDQLLLIHNRFQELAMKFELFQSQSPDEYESRLDRVDRQLRDISGKTHSVIEIKSIDPEDIQGQVHSVKCIYNALSDIKPEVENVIKMGRKIVDNHANQNLTNKIDALKKEFNQVGAKVIF